MNFEPVLKTSQRFCSLFFRSNVQLQNVQPLWTCHARSFPPDRHGIYPILGFHQSCDQN